MMASQDVEEGFKFGLADLGRSGTGAEEKGLAPVTPSPGFDLESYIANYTGRTRAYRLKYIALRCPTLQQDAFRYGNILPLGVAEPEHRVLH